MIAPEYPGNPERTAVGRLFHIGALVLLAASLFAAVVNFVSGEFRVTFIMIAAIVATGSLIVAAQRGHLRIARLALPPIMLVTFLAGPLIRDGVHDSAIAAVAATLVMAGVLMQWRALLAFIALTIGAFFAMGYAEIAGRLHNRLAGFTDVRFLVGISISFVFVAVVVRMLTDTMIDKLREAREKGAEAQRAHERLAVAMQASRASLWEWDIGPGTMYVDRRWAELLGFDAGDSVTTVRRLEGMIHTQDRDALIKAQLACMKGDMPHYAQEFRVRNAAGDWVWILNRGQVVERDRSGRAVRMAGIAMDVTARRNIEARLQQSEDRFAKIFNASPDAIVISRLSDGTYLEVNQRWLELMGYAREELIGRSSLDLGIRVNPGDRTRFVGQIRERGALLNFEAQFRKKSGAVIDAVISAEVMDIDGEPHLIVPLMDITERKRMEARIQQLATRDALTGLPNRLLLNDRLALSIDNARRHDGHVALLFIDLDRFKYINDSLGHVLGDAFLKAVAERLSGIVRKGDTLARIGGDEFVVLLEEVQPMEDAAGHVARKILGALAEPFSVKGHTLSCSCSIGISVFPSDSTDPQMLVRDADTAMYHVKERGRGAYRYFSQEMNSRMQERLQLEIGLRDAVANRQFELLYQPKVDIASGRIAGMEALLRWHHPAWGTVSPGRFIAVAEETGLIVDIGRWVIREACRQIRDWQTRGLAPHPVAVNLSVRQFMPLLVNEIAAALGAFDIDPALVELEITESLFMQNPEDIGAVFQGLSRLGTPVTIDDFGTGYSSLGYIKQFTVHSLKIDRSFVGDLAIASQSVAIVHAVITMCRGLGIRVVAEGVETPEQLEILGKLGCEQYQGYLFSRPVTAEEFERKYLTPVPAHGL